MRLWPYQMLKYLPTKQLVAQWRECLAISGSLASEKGLNHATVNRLKDYPIEHFAFYCNLVREAFEKRGFKIGQNTIEKLNHDINYENLSYHVENKKGYEKTGQDYFLINGEPLFRQFHSQRYLRQCLYSFQEKYDCKMINENEWKLLEDKFGYLFSNYFA